MDAAEARTNRKSAALKWWDDGDSEQEADEKSLVNAGTRAQSQ